MSTLAHIPLSSIVPGANPRRHFDLKAMDELTQSVKAKNGILQPILVRPFDDGLYQIVAGERRYRAAKSVLGEGYAIPAHVLDMNDQEAAAAALTENVIRACMSPVEEAEAAARLLAEFANDRDETARRLGWTRTMLDRRLALMNAAEEVRQALLEDKISLGHAELLAAAERSKQPKILSGLLAQTPMPTVAQLKSMLSEVARSLDTACFDKTDCLTCPQNSSIQASMFAESISAGNCTGPECYTAKTEEALERKRQELIETWPRVEIMRPGQNYTVIKLKVEGTGGVGEEQAQACKQCKNFGAAISAVPGKEGKVFESYCFDTPCNTRMVARALKAEAAAAASREPSSKPAKPAADKAAGTKPSGKTSTKPAAATLSSAVVEFRKKLWRKALAEEVGLTAERSLGMLIALALHRKGGKLNAAHVLESTKGTIKAFGFENKLIDGDSLGSTFGEALDVLDKVGKQPLADATLKLARSAAEEMDIFDVTTTLKLYQADLTRYFAIDAEYLDLLTKSEIQAVATEVGLDKAFGDKFKSLFSEKKPELIKKLEAVEGFNYAVLPKQLHFETPEKA